MTNNYMKHFERELKILEKTIGKKDELIIKNFIKPIKDILNIFAEEGHSGASAGLCIPVITETIKKTLDFEPLSPLTGKKSEWNDEEGTFQNNRDSRVFKGKSGIAYMNPIVFRYKTGNFTTGNECGIKCYKNIKFPFTPKIFYIDVKEDKKGNYTLTNPDQVKEVDKYYKWGDSNE